MDNELYRNVIFFVVVLVLGVLISLIPFFISIITRHPYKWWILSISIWSLVFPPLWVAMLVWAFWLPGTGKAFKDKIL
jgi:hypothetical protein